MFAADTPKSLLLVDDEEAFVQILATRLEMSGRPCFTAFNGEEALKLIARPELEAVLLDLNMPGLSGLDVLPRLKAARPDVEVIVLTGAADLAVAAKAMRRGANDYLLKPVDFPALLIALEKAAVRAGEHRERLRALQAGKLMALGALAEGVGHELNNPLQIIMQRAELLGELVDDALGGQTDRGAISSQADLREIGACAESIRKQAKRCGAITAQLLQLAGKARDGLAKTDLPALVERLRLRMEERMANLGMELVLDFESDMPLLPVSPADLEPVLAHLWRNAVDAVEATQQPGFVRITASAGGGVLRIAVADSGEGVRPEHMPRIFEPFFSTRAVGRGVGLGLTICHSMATDLRGTLRCLPNSPRGAIFVMEVPLNFQS